MPREYARLRHYVVFYLQNCKVFVLRILKNSVGKVDHFEIGQKNSVLLKEYARLRDYGVLYLVFLKVSTLWNLQNSVSKGCW